MAEPTGPAVRPDRDGRRRRRVLGPLALVVVVVVVLVGLASHGARDYYELQPGDAPLVTASPTCVLRSGASYLTLPAGGPCAHLTLPVARVRTVRGRILMVDVLEGKASALDYGLYELGLLGDLRPDRSLVPDVDFLGTTPASQLACQDDEEMAGATGAAPVAALSRLGYHVGVEALGAQVVQVDPGTAAAAAGVRCDDIVTAVGATRVDDAQSLADAIHAHRPGQRVTLTVRRGARQVVLSATLTGVPAMPAADGAPATAADPSTAFLGIASMDDVRYDLPFPVSIEVGDIGGPSAGLALTLGLLDALSDGDLTGGHTVAATGTIDPAGDVGAIGGAAQKAVAVHAAGATLFLVPTANLAAARSTADGMRVEAVSSLSQAIADLEAQGGALPPPSPAGSTTATDDAAATPGAAAAGPGEPPPVPA